MKAYWVSLYIKIENQENQKKYAKTVTPIIKSYGGIALVRGGKSKVYSGDSFLRVVIWQFPSFAKAVECHSSKEYQDGWDLTKETSVRHMQIVEGFSTE